MHVRGPEKVTQVRVRINLVNESAEGWHKSSINNKSFQPDNPQTRINSNKSIVLNFISLVIIPNRTNTLSLTHASNYCDWKIMFTVYHYTSSQTTNSIKASRVPMS